MRSKNSSKTQSYPKPPHCIRLFRIMSRTHFEVIESNIGSALEHGYANSKVFVGSLALADAQAECDSLRWWRKNQENRGIGGHRVFRPNPSTLAERTSYRPKPVRGLIDLGRKIEKKVQEAGERRGIEILKNWSMNHIVINKIPVAEDPLTPSIKEHLDPKYYTGVLEVVSLGAGELLLGETDDQLIVPTEEGGLETFICDDLATAMTDMGQPVAQVKHAVRVSEPRFSIIYASDTRPPQTFAEIARTQLQNR